jgi:hypothetical protein
MNRKAAFRILPLSLLLLTSCLSSDLAQAQQAPGAGGTGIYGSNTAGATSSAGASLSSGTFSSDSNVLTGAFGYASRMSLANSIPANANPANEIITEKPSTRSAWLAGSSFTGVANQAGWTAGSGTFGAHAGASWIAGADTFGLHRQPGDIWRAMPSSGAQQLGAYAQESGLSSLSSIAPGSGRFSRVLTPKGARLIKGAGLSSPSALHPAIGPGFRGSGAGPFTKRSGFGGAQRPFVPHPGTFGSSGMSGAFKPAQPAPSETLTGPILNDTLQRNGGPDSSGKLGLGTDDSTAGSSH